MKYLILSLLILNGCATAVSPYSTKDENAWFIEHKESNGRSAPIYCMANKTETNANPKCYTADILDVPVSLEVKKKNNL